MNIKVCPKCPTITCSSPKEQNASLAEQTQPEEECDGEHPVVVLRRNNTLKWYPELFLLTKIILGCDNL